MRWEHRVLTRLFIGSLCAVGATHASMVLTGMLLVGVLAGVIGFACGDYVAWRALT